MVLLFHVSFTLDFLSKLVLLGAILQGLTVSVLSWMQRRETPTAKFLFSLLITSLSLTLLNDLLQRFGIFTSHPKWLFLPIFYTFAFGPLLFFYTKATLYRSFKLHPKDLKHFLLPIGQVSYFFFMFFKNGETKQYLWQHDFSLFYGTFSYPIYLLIFTVYTYFAYRFVKHKVKSLHHIEVTHEERKRILRLQQVIKGWYFLLCINSFFIVFNFLTAHFLHVSLNNNRFYLFFSLMSFAMMVVWIGMYGYYKIVKSWIKNTNKIS